MTDEKEYVLAIDQGTFSTRAILFDSAGKALEIARQKVSLSVLDTQHVEQDATEILTSVLQVVEQIIRYAQQQSLSISCAGLATQRSSLLAWRPSDGEVISPVLSWMDTRAAQSLSRYEDHQAMIISRTGLRLSAHYGVSKMQWLLQHCDPLKKACRQQGCVITPIASYLLFHLTTNGNINIDIANASRSLLCNLFAQDWDARLLELFEISRKYLPDCHPVQYDYGLLKNSHTRIRAVNGDQTAAMYSNAEPEHEVLRINLGTGAFVLTPIDEKTILSDEFIQSGLLAGISNSTQQTQSYYIEGTVNGAGSAIQWLQQKLSSVDINQLLNECLSEVEPAIFINTVGGLGAPVWRADIEPFFLHNFNPQQAPLSALAGVLESIIFLLQLNIERLRQLKSGITRISISGGLSNIEFVCQTLANLTGLIVERSEDQEATARGIAWLALQNKSHWKKQVVARVFTAGDDEQLKRRYEIFKNQLSRP